MGSKDLEDAYLLIPLHKLSQKYVCFDGLGERLVWRCLPFGLNVAPWLYTKITKPIVNYLRSRNLSSAVYLDDWLCLGNTYEKCLYNLKFTMEILEFLGFIINKKKSKLVPQNTCQFLGLILNSQSMSIQLPHVKREKILTLLKYLRKVGKCSIRESARLVGCIVAACPSIAHGWLYSKSLERVKYLNFLKNSSNYSAHMTIPRSLNQDLDWWEDKILTNEIKIRQFNFAL